jgi:ATP-dependent Lon protease
MKGDVSSTLLELLNPEQSNQFRDSYLDLEFDFSECIFICTSNSIANMLQPLIDRIEVIHVPAYLPIEKLNIAKQYLIPQLEKEYNFFCENENTKNIMDSAESIAAPVIPIEKSEKTEKKSKKAKVQETQIVKAAVPYERVTFTDASIMEIINHYCHYEAGVRNLKKALDRVFRKIVTKLEGSSSKTEAEVHPEVEYQINTKNVEKFLDVPPTDDAYFANLNKTLPIGSSNGLAYVNDGYGTLMKI